MTESAILCNERSAFSSVVNFQTIITFINSILSFKQAAVFVKGKLLQALKLTDYGLRAKFSNDTLMHANKNFMDYVVLINESTFHLHAYVNIHNASLWSLENPHEVLELQRDSPKLNVFSAISRSKMGNYQNNRQGNQWFESRNRFQNDDRRFNDRGYQFKNRGQNDDYNSGDQKNRNSRENFSRSSRKQMGRLNVLKESDIKDFIGESKILLDFDRKSLAIPDSQINKVVKTVDKFRRKTKTNLEEKQKRELKDLFNSFQGLFSDKPGLTHVLYHDIDTGDSPLVVSRPYRYDRVKQEILDYHVEKMLKEGTIIPIQSPYASLVVLCRKNNGLKKTPDNPEAYKFALDYRKLNAITKYPRYPLPLIDDLIMNILRTGIMFALDLRSVYFQMAVNPSDIVKTAFVTKNGTYAFRRMPFGLSGAAPNF
ncbi:retrovirus-related Pol polyprotein from transposon 17.6 [Trichonephila clavipes]|nr:retrovirus-related Pol polyprotein from transposon 17.6 [Trichonephila clavipes]